MNKLHIKIDKENPAFEWLKTQADQIGAKGHIGTHLDCYTTTPQNEEYELSVYLIDCRNGLPDAEFCHSLPELEQKVLMLYTGNMEQNGYGYKAYFETATYISEEALRIVLSKHPQFIIIDSHGIGKKGEEHIYLDKLCESKGCHVIENANITSSIKDKIHRIHIQVDVTNQSTGKPCTLFYLE